MPYITLRSCFRILTVFLIVPAVYLLLFSLGSTLDNGETTLGFLSSTIATLRSVGEEILEHVSRGYVFLLAGIWFALLMGSLRLFSNQLCREQRGFKVPFYLAAVGTAWTLFFVHQPILGFILSAIAAITFLFLEPEDVFTEKTWDHTFFLSWQPFPDLFCASMPLRNSRVATPSIALTPTP